ncbi:hypothetical protein AcW2_001063 [Taiwanofungus camphoratus]|nr:hypothetical protein AcW2_001063 [Antrodia cinnamomea]
MLDLALTQIGERGAGGELFVLERGFAYHNALLCRCADDSGELRVLGKLRLSPPDVRRQSDARAGRTTSAGIAGATAWTRATPSARRHVSAGIARPSAGSTTRCGASRRDELYFWFL